MAKTSTIHKERRKQKCVSRLGEKRAALREKCKSINVEYDVRIEAQEKLQKLPRNSSPTRVRNRCRSCGRPRGVYRKFGLCRIHLREALMRGDVTGGRKSSW